MLLLVLREQGFIRAAAGQLSLGSGARPRPALRHLLVASAFLLAIGLASSALAASGAAEATVAEILSAPSDYADKLVRLRGTASSTLPGQAVFEDGTGQIALRSDSLTPPEGSGELLALVLQPVLFGQPSLKQVQWRGEAGPPESEPFDVLVGQFDLGRPDHEMVKYCDRYLLAKLGMAGAPEMARVVRVVVVGPREVPAQGECRYAIGIFPQEWEQTPPQSLRTTPYSSALRVLELAVVFPDATVEVVEVPDWPEARAYQISNQGAAWSDLRPSSALAGKLDESLGAAAKLVLEKVLTGGLLSLLEVIEPFLRQEEAPPIGDLSWLEFSNRYDLLAFPDFPVTKKQAALFLVRLNISGEADPLVCVIVKGEAWFSRKLGLSDLVSQELAGFHEAVSLAQPADGDPENTLDRFFSAISRRDWDAALDCVYQSPDLPQATARQTWINVLEGAFSDADLLQWRIRGMDRARPDIIIATVELTLRDETGPGETVSALTLALRRDGSEWRITSRGE